MNQKQTNVRSCQERLIFFLGRLREGKDLVRIVPWILLRKVVLALQLRQDPILDKYYILFGLMYVEIITNKDYIITMKRARF